VKILKFWRTELSYAQNKNRGKKMRLLGMGACPSLDDIMEIRCNKVYYIIVRRNIFNCLKISKIQNYHPMGTNCVSLFVSYCY
jgi:hypothetical protein